MPEEQNHHLKKRIRKLNGKKSDTDNKGGMCVVYIMSRDQRVQDNHALLAAQKHALAKELPLVVVFCFYAKSGYRTREHYEFMINGLTKVEKDLNDLSLPFVFLVGNPKEVVATFVRSVDAEAVYYDFNPLRGPRGVQGYLARTLDVPMYVVDTHNIVPVWVTSEKKEFGAYTIRPKIHKKLAEFLVEPEKIIKHPHSWAGELQTLSDKEADITEIVEKLDTSGFKHGFISGEAAALKHLEEFIENKLERYAVDRNNPSRGSQSDLSPYLHFGQISALRVALRLQEESHKSDNDLHFLDSPKMPKPEDAETTTQHGIDSLVEEMVVRKELSDNFCYYDENYDSIKSAPDWAKKTLDDHLSDVREFLYSKDDLEKAKTHDDAWNAAQKQLTTTGKMHGYMRMYWAKKVLEWTESPEVAIEILIDLNDRYSIDGGDPNGYTGIMWSVCGVHDRPWTEREIFGKIRYMNYAGLKRKFDIEAYINNYK